MRGKRLTFEVTMLTRNQKLAIIGVIIFSIIDLGLTAYGVLFMQVFVEANPLFTKYPWAADPFGFISLIGAFKIAFIGGIVALSIWFNSWDHQDKLRGGDICCYTALGGYALFLGMLGYMNYGRIIF